MQVIHNTFADKIQRNVSRFLRFSLLVAAVFAFIRAQWEIGAIATIIFTLTFIPIIIERGYKIYLPAEFELFIVAFLFATLYLGEIQHYYAKFWWWDLMLHASSAIAIGFIGFMIMYILYYNHRIETKPIWFAIFAFCFALAIGAIWEVFEFGVDQLFGYNMQKSGLVDTMWDLIVDTLGALLTSTIGFIYLKRKRHSLFTVLLTKFLKRNPKYAVNLVDYPVFKENKK